MIHHAPHDRYIVYQTRQTYLPVLDGRRIRRPEFDARDKRGYVHDIASLLEPGPTGDIQQTQRSRQRSSV